MAKKASGMKKTSVHPRVSGRAIAFLEQARKKFRLSTNQVVDRLLSWTAELDQDELDLIFRDDRGLPAILKLTEFVQGLAWGDHAFRAGERFSTWSLQEYYRIFRDSNSHQGINQFSAYRIAYSWARWARVLRRAALSQIETRASEGVSSHKLYQMADKALCCAISHNKVLLEQRKHPVVTYNLACEYAIRGLYAWECSLLGDENADGPSSAQNDTLQLLIKAICKEVSHKALDECFSNSIVNSREGIRDFVDRCSEECINQLNRIPENYSNEDDPWVDFSFFWMQALEDEDLTIVRAGKRNAEYRSFLNVIRAKTTEDVFATLSKRALRDSEVKKVFDSLGRWPGIDLT